MHPVRHQPPSLLPRPSQRCRSLADVAVNGRQRSRAFRTRPEADRYRSGLLVAQQSGERFDDETGEPVSWQPLPDEIQTHDWARRWVGEQWPEWAPRTRASAVEALTRLLPLLVPPTAPPKPDGLRPHLSSWLRSAGGPADETVVAWLDRWSLQLGQLNRSVLATVDQTLGVRDDGESLSPSTAARFRKVSRACIRRAVDLGVLDVDPWPPAPRGCSQRKAATARRPVAGPVAARSRDDAADDRGDPHPSAGEPDLPGDDRGRVLRRPPPVGGRDAPGQGAARAGEGLGPHRRDRGRPSFDEPGEPKTGPRSVPIPAHLVGVLESWVDAGGDAGDDLLFRTRAGLRPTFSNWSRSLRRAREKVCQPPMRIYDCRHAAATTWLKAGVPLGEVARRMGHSVETLVSTYVGTLDGDEALANKRIDAVLGTKKVTLPVPAGEG